MREQRLFGSVHRAELGQRRMQCEHAAKLGLPHQVGRKVATQSGVSWIASRSEGGQAVGRAALDDEDKFAVRSGPGESDARGEQRSSASARFTAPQ